MALLNQILCALPMAACCGFRGFMPLFLTCLFMRINTEAIKHLNPDVIPYFVKNDFLLYFLGVLAIFEILVDKASSIDNLWNGIFMIARPVAGTVAAFAFLNFNSTTHNIVISMAIGALITLPLSSFKSTARISTDSKETDKTLWLNILMSIVEDVEAAGASILSILMPNAGVLVVPAVYVSTTYAFKNLRFPQKEKKREIRKKDIGEGPGVVEIKLSKRLRRGK